MTIHPAIFIVSVLAAFAGGNAQGVLSARPVPGPPSTPPADQVNARELVTKCYHDMTQIVLGENAQNRKTSGELSTTIAALKEEVATAQQQLLKAIANTEDMVKARCSARRK